MEDDTELVFDFEVNIFNSDSGEMYLPLINIEGEFIHDDALKKLLKSDEEEDKNRRKELITKIVENDYRDVFKYILLHGYKLDEILNDKGQTALHLAFHNNLGYLLEPNGAFFVPDRASDINYTDSDGLTHLHIACVIGSTKLVEKLLKNKSTNVNADYQIDRGDLGKGTFKPLHFAVLNLRMDIVKLLLEHGADVHATDFLGRTPLHIAAGVCTYRPFYNWTRDWKIVEILLKYQSKVSAVDKNGNTPLLSIYENYFQYDAKFLYYVYINDTQYQRNEHMKDDLIKSQSKKLEILLKYGAKVSVSNNNGDTIIHLVTNNLKTLRAPPRAADVSFDDTYHVKMVKSILKADSKVVNSANNEKETPLQLAVSYLSLDIVKLLLKYKVDMKSLNFDDKNDKYFQFLCIAPNFEPVKNLISIKKLLVSKGYTMSPEDNLTILKFFVHDFENCKCGKAIYSDDALLKIMNLLNFGSTTHVKHVLKNLDNDILGTIEDALNYTTNKQVIDFLNYLKYIKYANVYVDQQVRDAITGLYQVFELPEVTFHEPKAELRLMKSKKLKSKIDLHTVLMKHPHDIYRYIKDEKFDDKYFKNFPIYKDIIRGHFTRSIIRHHIEQSAHEYIQKKLFSSLPTFCSQNILYSLTNEDILNTVVAITD